MKLEALAALREAYERCDDLDMGTTGLELRIVENHSTLQAIIERNFDRIAASLSEAREVEPSLSQSVSHLDDAIRFGRRVADARLIDERSTWNVRMMDLAKLQLAIRVVIEQHGSLN